MQLQFLRLTTILFIFLNNSITVAQTNIEPSQLVKKGDSLKSIRSFDEALSHFEKALPLFKQKKQWNNVVGSHAKIASIFLDKTKAVEAKIHIDKALQIIQQHNLKNLREEAVVYQKLASYYAIKSRFDLKLEHHLKALEIYKRTGPKNHPDIAKTHLDAAFNLAILSKFKKAIAHLDSVKKICNTNKSENIDNLITYYRNRGTIHSIMAENDLAKKSLQSALNELYALPKEKQKQLWAVFSDLGDTHYNAREFDLALEYYLRAMPLKKEIDGDKNGKAISMYANIAKSYSYLGFPLKGLDYSKKTLSLAKEVFGENHYLACIGQNTVGVAYYYLHDYKNAKKSYLEEIENLVINFGEVHKDIAFKYGNLADVSNLLENYQDAIDYGKKALYVGTEVFGPKHTVLTYAYKNLGIAYMHLGNNQLALESFQKMLSINQNTHGKKHTELLHTYKDLGNFYRHIQDFDTALVTLEKGINMYAVEYKQLLESDRTEFSTSLLFPLIEILAVKAKTLQEKYSIYGDLDLIHESNKIYNHVNSIMEQIQQRVTSYQDKLRLSTFKKYFLAGAMDTRFLLYQKDPKDGDKEKLFSYSELSKANTLSESLRSPNKNIGTYSDIIGLETELKNKRVKYLSQIKKEKETDSTSTTLKNLQEQLFVNDQRYDSLMFDIQKKHPTYFTINHDTNSISVKELRTKLPPNTSLIEYFIKTDTTYIFALTKNKLNLKRLYTPDLSVEISDFQSSIESQNLLKYKKLGRKLYNKIIAPIKKDIDGDALIIVPSGPTWNLNFELLLTGDESSNDPKKLPYLLKEYAISYANSASLLFNYPYREEKTSKECLAFSFSKNPTSMGSSSKKGIRLRALDDDLPGTRKEIKTISKIVDGKYFFGENASERTFKKESGGYSILHLALHGEVNHKNPEDSYLNFTKTKDSIEDGLLYMYELFNLDLSAELAVLSACNTGSGKLAAEEGIMSLGNAFQHAGTKSLVMSKWEVSDETTPEIMKLFYQNLKDGMGKSKALQQAKLNFLKNSPDTKSNPFYWGSFYLIGDTNSMDLGTNDYWIYIVFGIIALLTTLYLKRFIRS